MPIFRDCFPRKEFKRWLRETRRVTQALGEARDLDVQILFLQAYQGSGGQPPEPIRDNEGGEDPERYLPDSASITSGINPADPDKKALGTGYISSYLQTRRDALQPQVTDALDSLEESGVIASMDTVVRAAMKKRRKRASKSERKGLQPFAAASLSSALDDLLSYEESLYQPDARSEHHAMRIAAKRLRYRLEIFRPLYGRDVTKAIRVMKRLQTLLGELHDCDVWIVMLPGLLEREQPGFPGTEGEDVVPRDTEAQIRVFIEDQKIYRDELYDQVIRYWKRKTRDNFFQELRETIIAGASSDPPEQKDTEE
jgi:CHAD domain-containing protein